MNTNDIIIGKIKNGSFKFPIEFDMFGMKQKIQKVTFDTGCSHSLISVKSLNIGNNNIKDLELDALLDKDIKIGIGTGVESKGINTDVLKTYVQEINECKKDLQKMNMSNESKDNAVHNRFICINANVYCQPNRSKKLISAVPSLPNRSS